LFLGAEGLLRGFHRNQKKRIGFLYWNLAWWLYLLLVLVGGDLQSFSVLSSFAGCTVRGRHGQIDHFSTTVA
jgi:hypothetical protein